MSGIYYREHWFKPTCYLVQTSLSGRMNNIPEHAQGHYWILADGSSWSQTGSGGWGVATVTSDTKGRPDPREPSLLVYRLRGQKDSAVVEALRHCLWPQSPEKLGI